MPKNYPYPDDDAEPITIEGSHYQDKTELQEDIDTQEREILSEFGADQGDVKWLIKVYRVQQHSKHMPWLFDCQPADLPILPYLRDNHGTGNYEARVYKNGKLHRKLTYSVEAPSPSPASQPHYGNGAGSANDPTRYFADIIEQQNKRMERLENLLLESRQGGSGGNINETMQVVSGLIQSLSGVMPQPQQNSGAISPDKMIDLFKAGMEASKGGEGSNWVDLVRDALKSDLLPQMGKVADAAQRAQHPQRRQAPSPQQGQPAQPSQYPPAGQGGTPPYQGTPENDVAKETIMRAQNEQMGVDPAGNQEMSDDDYQKLQQVADKVQLLVVKAQSGSDPTLYGDLILEMVPRETVEQLVWREDIYNLLTSLDPKVANVWPWFNELIEYVREVLTDDGSGDSVNQTASPQQASPDVSFSDPARAQDISNGASAGSGRGEENPSNDEGIGQQPAREETPQNPATGE